MPGRHEEVEMRDVAAKREMAMRERRGDVLRPMIAFLVKLWLLDLGR
jgi:hypothetical protein